MEEQSNMEEQSKLAEKILDQVADAVICAHHPGTITSTCEQPIGAGSTLR